MKRIKYELDKEAVLRELRKIPNVKAVKFELPTNNSKDDKFTEIYSPIFDELRSLVNSL